MESKLLRQNCATERVRLVHRHQSIYQRLIPPKNSLHFSIGSIISTTHNIIVRCSLELVKLRLPKSNIYEHRLDVLLFAPLTGLRQTNGCPSRPKQRSQDRMWPPSDHTCGKPPQLPLNGQKLGAGVAS